MNLEQQRARLILESYGEDLSLQPQEIIEKGKSTPCWEGYEAIGMKEKGGKKVPNCVPIKKAEKEEGSELLKAEFNQDQLKELVDEHENLIKVLESEDKADDKKELEKQKKELADYKSKISKSEAYAILGIKYDLDLEKGKAAFIGEIRQWGSQKFKKQADGQWLNMNSGKTVSLKNEPQEKDPKKVGEPSPREFTEKDRKASLEKEKVRRQEESDAKKAKEERAARVGEGAQKRKEDLKRLRSELDDAQYEHRDAISDLEDYEARRNQLEIDQEEEVGSLYAEGKHKEGDALGQEYGSKLNDIEVNIGRLESIIPKLKDKADKLEHRVAVLEDKVDRDRESSYNRIRKSEAYTILGIEFNPDLEKGTKANIGEVRTWASGKKK